MSSQQHDQLSQSQLEAFLRDGVLVVENVLTDDDLRIARNGLRETMLRCGVADIDAVLNERTDETDLQLVASDVSDDSVRAFQKLSSTNGSGGVLDLFYEEWKFRIASNERLWSITRQLWATAYCHDGETREEADVPHRWQPYGAFDPQRGYMYVDRIGFRLPTVLSDLLGRRFGQNRGTQPGSAPASSNRVKKQANNNKAKTQSLQRSLTPHLDCCPETYLRLPIEPDRQHAAASNPPTHAAEPSNDTDKPSKWRPIQCFVSLTNNTTPNTGGFEAAKGFHRDFDEWRQRRKPAVVVKKVKQSQQRQSRQQQQSTRTHTITVSTDANGRLVETHEIQPPCVGEYTHIRPKEDREVMNRIEHIPVRAGSTVFWDNRIPHANAYRHDGVHPRSVVYCSFLPDVPVNRIYVQDQLAKFRAGVNPTDQWIHPDDNRYLQQDSPSSQSLGYDHPIPLQPLARKLMGIDPW